jgi:DNA-binding transcriptional ArsR family regulator
MQQVNAYAGPGGRRSAAPRQLTVPLNAAAEPVLSRIATGIREPMRLQLLGALLQGERSVTELTELLGRSQPSVSKHLRVLRDQQLVRTRRERNRVFYRIANEDRAGQAVSALLESLQSSLPPRESRRRS